MSRDEDHLDRVESILRELSQADEHQRDALLRHRCGDDEALRRDVMDMLQAQAEVSERFLNRSIVTQFCDQSSLRGGRIGPWIVDELIGAGGMSAVYRGHRADGAFEATVAVKFIRAGAVVPGNSVAHDRFIRERQILATLDHPNVARLLDGGVTDDGKPYFVMEFVAGRSLIEHCDASSATIDERLQLFEEVCQAVQHAHGNLIVHRDLKPSNILVDETGRPRLLDFGIAGIVRDADADSGDTRTLTAERCFTPQYAAPEQIRGEPATVATDVYALGVILYELLSGDRPYQVTTGYAPADAQLICETDPPPPSRRLDSVSDESSVDVSEIAQMREMDVSSLRRALKGDLDHIVMMALRKEPSRRYATVEAFRADLERFRRGLPVAARRDTWRYRSGKFIRRHRVSVALSAVLGIVLIAAALTSSMLAFRLSEHTVALGEALDEAVEQRAAAEREFRRALSSSSTLIQTVAALSGENPSAQQQIISQLHDRIDRLDAMTLPITPDAEIATRQSLAMLARTVDAFDIALEQNQRVLMLAGDRPEESDVREQAYGQIGWLHLQRGEPEKAIDALRACRAIAHDRGASEHLTRADVQLVEALLQVGEATAAQVIVAESEVPPPPAGAFIEARVRDLELRFGVSLLADESN